MKLEIVVVHYGIYHVCGSLYSDCSGS